MRPVDDVFMPSEVDQAQAEKEFIEMLGKWVDLKFDSVVLIAESTKPQKSESKCSNYKVDYSIYSNNGGKGPFAYR